MRVLFVLTYKMVEAGCLKWPFGILNRWCFNRQFYEKCIVVDVTYFGCFKSRVVPGVPSAGRCDTVLSPLTVCSSTMAAMGPEDRAGAAPGGTAVCPAGPRACISTATHDSSGPDRQQTVVSRGRGKVLPLRSTTMINVLFYFYCEVLFLLLFYFLSVIPTICLHCSLSMQPFSGSGRLRKHTQI